MQVSFSTQRILAQLAFDVYVGGASSPTSRAKTPNHHVNVLSPSAPDNIVSLSVIFVAIVCNCRKEVGNHLRKSIMSSWKGLSVVTVMLGHAPARHISGNSTSLDTWRHRVK